MLSLHWLNQLNDRWDMIGCDYDKLARTFVCLGAGVVCGRVGLVVGAIFRCLPPQSKAVNTVIRPIHEKSNDQFLEDVLQVSDGPRADSKLFPSR